MAVGFLFVLLLLAAILFLVMPLLVSTRGEQQADNVQESEERKAANVALYREREKELITSLEKGEITPELKESLLAEQQKLLLADAASNDSGEDENQSASQLGGRWLVWGSLVLVLGGSLAWYQWRGSLPDLSIRDSYVGVMKGEVSTAELRAQLQARVGQRPENGQLWYLLAQALSAEGSYSRSVDAYKKVIALGDTSPRVMSEYAQVLFAANGNQMSPEVESAAGQALSQDPSNRAALGIMGIAAFQVEEYQAAIDYWQRLLSTLPAGSPELVSITAGIAKAKSMLGGEAADELVIAETSQASTAGIKVAVSLAPGVKAQPQETVFVYIRAWKGAPMPLAVKRLTVANLSTEIELSDKDMMMQGTKLSAIPQLQVVARLSRKGTPAPAPGDWQGLSQALNSADLPLSLTLTITDEIR
ncbi:MAG: c-type cytochrome biogenesis protein CcmI [Cellvibrionaceae bacterium]